MTTLLRTSLVTLLAALCSMPALASGEIHYIGFNRFVADHEAQSSVTFDEYLGKLRPIMDRYGMTVEAYDVLHGGSDQLSANIVTFGTAKDQESFQAFFSDAEFQQVFPMLIGALSEHQVVFTSGPFAIDSEHHGNTLLSMSWFDGDQVEGIAKITINRPRYYNAFTPKTNMEMIDAMDLCRESNDVNVVFDKYSSLIKTLSSSQTTI